MFGERVPERRELQTPPCYAVMKRGLSEGDFVSIMSDKSCGTAPVTFVDFAVLRFREKFTPERRMCEEEMDRHRETPDSIHRKHTNKLQNPQVPLLDLQMVLYSPAMRIQQCVQRCMFSNMEQQPSETASNKPGTQGLGGWRRKGCSDVDPGLELLHVAMRVGMRLPQIYDEAYCQAALLLYEPCHVVVGLKLLLLFTACFPPSGALSDSLCTSLLLLENNFKDNHKRFLVEACIKG